MEYDFALNIGPIKITDFRLQLRFRLGLELGLNIYVTIMHTTS